jgi:hypothetical protein
VKGRFNGWLWLVVGLLWLSLTGACTFNVYRSDQTYGFWWFGLYIVMAGLIPFFVGLRRVAGPRTAGAVLGLVATIWLVVTLVVVVQSAITSRTPSDLGQAIQLLIAACIILLGPPVAFLLWARSMLTAKRAASDSIPLERDE